MLKRARTPRAVCKTAENNQSHFPKRRKTALAIPTLSRTPRTRRCEVCAALKSCIILLLNRFLRKRIVHELIGQAEKDRILRMWKLHEVVVTVISFLYNCVACLYIVVFSLLCPLDLWEEWYISSVIGIGLMMLVKPLGIATFVFTMVMSSRRDFVIAHFPALVDFDYLYVLQDAQRGGPVSGDGFRSPCGIL